MNHRTSLAAAALLATVSGTAAAQMNVTLYGVVDAAVGRFKGAPGGVNAQDQPVSKVDGGGLSTSHWGLRGSEDLGGGLFASFELSSFMRNDTGSVGRSDAIPAPLNVAADTFWSRAAWVGLNSATLGRLRLGNVTTLMFFNSITSNAFGDSTVFSPINLVTFIGSPQAGGTGWTNSVVYDSPSFSGFGFSAARSMAEAQGGHNSAVRLAYAKGPWAASLAWQDVKKNPLTFADGTSSNNTRSWQLAASYDFQVVKVFTHLGRIDNQGTESAPLDISYRLWDVSASLPVGAGRVLAGYAQRKTDDRVGPVPATAAGGNLERRVLTVGYDHYLSTRTDLYAMLMNDKTRTATLPAPPTAVSASATSFAVGMRHRF
jgi:predicted porin